MSLAEVEGIVTLNVENPNASTLSAKELNYAVAVAGNELVTGQSKANISIPALAMLIETFPQIMKSGLADYVITGKLKTNFATIPFSKKGEFKLPFNSSTLTQQ